MARRSQSAGCLNYNKETTRGGAADWIQMSAQGRRFELTIAKQKRGTLSSLAGIHGQMFYKYTGEESKRRKVVRLFIQQVRKRRKLWVGVCNAVW